MGCGFFWEVKGKKRKAIIFKFKVNQMTNLYVIKKEFQAIIDRAENATSEEFQALESELVINQESFKEKALSYVHVIKNLESDVAGIDAEIKRLMSMKASKSNLVEKLEKNIVDAMVMFDSEKLDFGTFKLSTRKSKSVDTSEADKNIKDFGIENCPDLQGYFLTKVSIQADKKAIKELLESGYELEGCFIVEKKSLQIK